MMSRSAVRALVVILITVVILVGGAGAFAWWKLSSLKEQLLAQLGESIGAQVQVASFEFDVWKGELHAAGIVLTNQDAAAPWEKGDISQATLHFKLRDIFESSLPVSVEVDSWNLQLHSPLRTAETPPTFPGSIAATGQTSSTSAVPSSQEAPSRIHVRQITGSNGTVETDFSDDSKLIVHGVRFDASDNGAGIWTTQLSATSIKAATLEAAASSVQIRGEPGKVTFSDLRMQVASGAITGEGDVALDGAHDLNVTLKTVNVPLTMLVATKWQMALSGLVDGDYVYRGNDQGGSGKGQISVSHGIFNILPWLGKVTAMVGMQDISNVEVDKATTDLAWKDGTLHLSNIDVRKTDVTRVAGEVDIDAKGEVDGLLKLGLPSSVTAKWPAVQTQVFPVALEDYNWADVHLTGTADHLQEDLTSRLIAAGLGQGGDLMNQAAQKATDLFHSLIGK